MAICERTFKFAKPEDSRALQERLRLMHGFMNFRKFKFHPTGELGVHLTVKYSHTDTKALIKSIKAKDKVTIFARMAVGVGPKDLEPNSNTPTFPFEKTLDELGIEFNEIGSTKSQSDARVR